jgi:(p)ppGpp synthase/HD superfamily hydrolase
VALLHDILEDTDTTVDELRGLCCDDDIIQAVVAITRRKDEKLYFDFIERVKGNDLAKLVKIYDLEDNMDIRRLKELEEKESKLSNKIYNMKRVVNTLSGYVETIESFMESEYAKAA